MSIFEFIAGTIVILLLGILMFLFSALGMDMYKTLKYGNGWVKQERAGTAVISWEEDTEAKCVSYIDVWGNPGKVCGVYTILDMRKN